jgi:hypothetical protein
MKPWEAVVTGSGQKELAALMARVPRAEAVGMEPWDAVVIGSGPNELAAALTLLKGAVPHVEAA